MPTIKYTREDIAKLENERDQLKHQGNLLREDIALLKKNQKTRDKLIDNLKEENANLNNELDQYRTAHDKLTAGLKEAVAESIQYKRERDELSNKLDKECNDNYKLEGQLHDMTKQRDELIKDVEKLREEKAGIEMYLDAVKVYKPMYEEVNKKYNRLTEHIRLKALHNPSEHRYFRLVHFIDEIEGDTHEGY